jgi:formimidoylglutamate deiminase
VRAVNRAWLTEFARAPKRLTHMHVAEQAREVEACVAEHGLRPFEYLSELGLLHEAFTAVHAIEVTPSEISLLARQKSHVCACPSTEKNLGDGIVPADAWLKAQVPVCLGSDSQAEIDLLNEARSLEGHLRLSQKRRAVLDDGTGEVDNLGRRLLSCATREGAQSLQLDVGTLSVGQPADFFTLDLNHPSLLGAPDDALLSAVAMGAEKAALVEVAVQGKTIVTEGRHPQTEAIAQGYQHMLKGLSF